MYRRLEALTHNHTSAAAPMFIVPSYAVAVALLVITMLCWGSWANTQKLASREWPFQLFYWDYSLGTVLLALLFGVTLGSAGEGGRPFFQDLAQASSASIGWAVLGGVIFNLSNILLSAAIDIAGMAVAFPVGVGLAMVFGVVTNFNAAQNDPLLLFLGVALVVIAIVFDALAYRRVPAQGTRNTTRGLLLSIVSGLLMGNFFRFVVMAMSPPENGFTVLQAGKMGPYAAFFVFTLALFASNVLWNTIMMYRPLAGRATTYGAYFREGTPRLHVVGILGGMIWATGTAISYIVADKASPAISFGLGQGAILIGALWGIFIWKEFRSAPAGTNRLLAGLVVFFVVGLALIIYARA